MSLFWHFHFFLKQQFTVMFAYYYIPTGSWLYSLSVCALFFHLILMLFLCFPSCSNVEEMFVLLLSLLFLWQEFAWYSHLDAVLKCLPLIDVLTDRLKAYTIHTGCWSCQFNLISFTSHYFNVFTVVAIFFILWLMSMCEWVCLAPWHSPCAFAIWQ